MAQAQAVPCRLRDDAGRPAVDRFHALDEPVAAVEPDQVAGPELAVGDFAAGLVYAASGAVVDTTVVNGKVLMREGIVPAAAEVVAKVRARCRRLGLA